ncbi:unnamed protein product [Paramecium octaurelia]|uniref:Uncharacterized protein n=1 Tax=Paramecium octaurelia TaxID=43137 RepID=A0A8S1VTR9_PAROT|nr:unnamed protein product [Paramecium octaurelia]
MIQSNIKKNYQDQNQKKITKQFKTKWSLIKKLLIQIISWKGRKQNIKIQKNNLINQIKIILVQKNNLNKIKQIQQRNKKIHVLIFMLLNRKLIRIIIKSENYLKGFRVTNSRKHYCMCEKVIPKIGQTRFEFEIHRISGWCEVGIGFREMIKQNGYREEGQGKGSYLLREQGSTYFHQSNNTQGQAFKFQVNDIVIMEVSIEQKQQMVQIQFTRLFSKYDYTFDHAN